MTGCERCGNNDVLTRVELGADYDGSMKRKIRLCENCTAELGKWVRNA